MKTTFETDEDKAALESALHQAAMMTEQIFDELYSSSPLREHRDSLINLRAKIFEFLELDDPNLEAVGHIQKNFPHKPELIVETSPIIMPGGDNGNV